MDRTICLLRVAIVWAQDHGFSPKSFQRFPTNTFSIDSRSKVA